MDRRRFLLTSVAGALAGTLDAGAQPAGKVPRIGVLFVGPRNDALSSYVTAQKQAITPEPASAGSGTSGPTAKIQVSAEH